MKRQEALERLSSSSAHDRLKAARLLAGNSDPSDLKFLQEAMIGETVSYVRTCLKRAIERASNSEFLEIDATSEEYEIPPDVLNQIRKKVAEEVTGQILHEISSPVGLVAATAAREIPHYENSKTKRHIENLKQVFEAIEQLKSATAVPRPEEFDLAELLAEVVSEVVGSNPVEVSLYGAKPMLITSDRALLRFAISNGIRNAVEAVAGSTGGEPYPIIVTWGKTDVDYWVVMLDRGPGLVGPAESAFGIGKTTKKGHSGFGLAIAKQAIETLDGECTLHYTTECNTRFEIRWKR